MNFLSKPVSKITDNDRSNAYVIFAIAFLIVGLFNLFFNNLAITGSFSIMSIVFLSVSLFYSTNEFRQKRKREKASTVF